jgi:hypothetical protein
MEYNMQIKLNFEQLLQLILQLPDIEQKKLVSVLAKTNRNTLPTIRMRTVAEILASDYIYPARKPQHLVGGWSGTEDAETLIALRTK